MGVRFKTGQRPNSAPRAPQQRPKPVSSRSGSERPSAPPLPPVYRGRGAEGRSRLAVPGTWQKAGQRPKELGRSPGLRETDRLAKVFLGVSGAVYAPCIVQGKCRVERRGYEGLEYLSCDLFWDWGRRSATVCHRCRWAANRAGRHPACLTRLPPWVADSRTLRTVFPRLMHMRKRIQM